MSSTGTSSTSSSSLRSSTGTSHVWDRNVSLSGTCKCTESRGIGQYYRCLRCRQAVHKDCVTTYDNTVCEPSYRDLVIGQEVEHPTPLIAFVSSKAGGGQGKALIEKLQIALSADQVFDLFADPSNGTRTRQCSEPSSRDGSSIDACVCAVGPRAGIDKWKNTPNLRILVCGGDGTVCWVLHELVDRTPFQKPNEIDLAQSAKVPISTHCIVVPDSRADVPTPLHTDDSATDVGSFPAPPMHEAPAPPTPEEQALATQALATEPTSRESAEDATYIDLSQEIRLPEADELLPLPPVAVLPLGTGNDTSRILGWGGGYSNEDIVGVLESICSAQPVLMDRWTVEFEPPLQDGAKVINSLGMLNYFRYTHTHSLTRTASRSTDTPLVVSESMHRWLSSSTSSGTPTRSCSSIAMSTRVSTAPLECWYIGSSQSITHSITHSQFMCVGLAVGCHWREPRARSGGHYAR